MAATISISHKGQSYNIQVDLTSTISSFQIQLKELTSVPVENQKLLFKGKRASANGGDTLETFGLKDGTKVQMLGSTAEEISGLRVVEDEKKRMEQILRDRETQLRVRQLSARIGGQLMAMSMYRHILLRLVPKLQAQATVSMMSSHWHISQTPTWLALC